MTTMTQPELLEFLVELLDYAGKHAPGKYLISGLRPMIVQVERAPNDHGVDPRTGKVARRDGLVTIELADEAILDLRHSEGNDAWFVVRVRRDVLDRMKERKESPLILPGYLS